MLHRYKAKGLDPSWRRALYHFHVHRGRLALCLPLMRRWEHGDFFFTFSKVSWEENSISVLFEEDVFYLMTSPGYLQCIFRTISQLK